MSVVDYVGRTVDLLAFQGQFLPGQEEQLVQTLVPTGTGGFIIAGPEKVIQRAIIILCTVQGSISYQPDAGTRFMADAQAGLWRTMLDVSSSFYSAKIDLMRQLRNLQLPTDPPDEVLTSLDLLGVQLSSDKVALYLLVNLASGDTVRFIQPLPVTLK